MSDLAAFISVAQTQSLTKAAEQLALTKSSIGKAIRLLELQLNVRLLQRTTRGVRLIEDGEIYLDAAKAAVEGLPLPTRNFLLVGRIPPAGSGSTSPSASETCLRRHSRISIGAIL